jgi:hypothetical protein
MTETDRLKYLRIALLLVGAILVVGIYPLTIIWPSGWSWHTGQSEYLQMILGIFATLGLHRSSSNRTAAGRHRRWRRSGIYFLVTVSGLLARR